MYKIVSKRAIKEQEKLANRGFLLIDITKNEVFERLSPFYQDNHCNIQDDTFVSLYNSNLETIAKYEIILLRGLLLEKQTLAFVCNKPKDKIVIDCLRVLWDKIKLDGI